MTTRMKRTGALVGAAAVLSFAGYTIGSQAGDGVAESRDGSGQGTRAGGPGQRGLSSLADRLGVSASELEQALDDIRAQQQPPAGDPRDRFASGLAAKLGVDEAKVEEALDELRPERRERPRRGQLERRLARELGISVAKVRSAFREVKPGPAGRGRGPGDRDEMLGDLAKAMGVSVDDLEAAMGKVHPRGHGGPGSPGGPGGPMFDTEELAQKLGVDEEKLETALEELRAEHEAEHEQRRDEFAQALADRLGIDVEKVKDALPMGPPHHGGRGPRP